MKLSKPTKKIVENGITYLVRTSEQVEEDLQKLAAKSPRRTADEGFKSYWRKLLSAKIPICPVCGEHGEPLRRTIEGEILGCDSCLNIAGYYNPMEKRIIELLEKQFLDDGEFNELAESDNIIKHENLGISGRHVGYIWFKFYAIDGEEYDIYG